jgi:hypothetical protein
MKQSEFHVCWTMDCESVMPPINNPQLGRQAIDGYSRILDSLGWHGTFFVIPEEVAVLCDPIKSLEARGHEVGLHLHPKAGGRASDHLGTYSASEQKEIVEHAIAEHEKCLA